ncbi:MAG: hypothetical protein P8P81_06200 [Bacteroidia bacterium]|nr:hypothetical protein [Bacteroidia bacterium]
MHKLFRSCILILMLFPSTAFAQLSTSSPYSIFGLGELTPGGFTQHRGVGGASVSLRDQNNFSFSNPASYSKIRFTVYNVGAGVNFGKISDQTTEAETNSGNFNHFAMAFPLNTEKSMAFSFGVNQYSDVGYEIKNNINLDTPSYFNLYKGSGGINRLYIGYGVELMKNFSFGGNLNMNFGNIQSRKYRVYPNTDKVYSFSDETFFAYKGLDFDLGVQYSIQSKKGNEINHTLGAVFKGGSKLYGDGYRYAETFYGQSFMVGNTFPIDTLTFEDNKKDTVSKPLGVAVGYTLNKGDKWALSLEAEQILFSSVENKVSSGEFKDNMRYSAGFSIIPSPNYGERGSFFKHVRYSIGTRYEDLYYNFGSQTFREFGISFGLGLPVIKSVRLEDEKVPVVSRVNISAEYIKRGSSSNDFIQEDYFKIGLGLNLNDKWFTKRKYR